MARRVFLHVGLPKSGTTFVQAVLIANKDRLAEAGLLFPGEDGWKDQVRAVRDVRRLRHHRFNHRKRVPGAWDRLAAEMRAWDGDAVVSMEWLSRTPPEQVQYVLDSLAPAEVHVVFTVRDLARVMPASWQESVLNQNEWTWPEFLEQVSTEDPEVPREDRRFWKLHDLLALLARWTPSVPAERVHVITLPARGAPPELLWERFAGVLGIEGVPVQTEGVTRNDGLGVASTEVMRRLNIRTREAGITEDVHKKLLTKQLAKRGLGRRTDRDQRPTIPPDLHAWVRERAEEKIEGLRAAGVHLVGDLEELRPDLSRHAEPPPEPDDAVLLDIALDGMVLMTQQRAASAERHAAEVKELEAELKRAARREARAVRREGRARDQVARWEARPLTSALKVYARHFPLLVRVVRRARRAVAR